jgi:hypothetical protein
MHGLACHVWDRYSKSADTTTDVYFENRAEIVNGVVVDKTDGLEFQDNLFLSIREERKHKKDSWERYLRTKDCNPSKSGRYHRGSAKWRAQKVIEEALAEFRENKEKSDLTLENLIAR